MDITAGDFILLVSINNFIITEIWALSSYILAYSEIWADTIQALNVILQSLQIKDQQSATSLQIEQGNIWLSGRQTDISSSFPQYQSWLI